jgi:hypothetical protein
MQLTFEQSLKYDSVYIESMPDRRMFIHKHRSLAELEQIMTDLRLASEKFWNTKCRPLFDQIHKSGGKAHCLISHEHDNNGGRIDPWWLWEVADHGMGLSIGFNWCETPENPIHLELGQAYYDNERESRISSSRHYRFRELFRKKLISFLWDKENQPKQMGDIFKLTINDRLYLFIANMNEHGVMRWDLTIEPTGTVVEKTLTVEKK